MNYHDKSITFIFADKSKVSVDVPMDIRLTPAVKLALLAEHAPEAVEMIVYTHWNNADVRGASFSSGMNYISYHNKFNDKWMEYDRNTWTDR